MQVILEIPDDILTFHLNIAQSKKQSWEKYILELLTPESDRPSLNFYRGKTLEEKLGIAIQTVVQLPEAQKFTLQATLPEQAWRVTLDGERRQLGKLLKEKILEMGLATFDDSKRQALYTRTSKKWE